MQSLPIPDSHDQHVLELLKHIINDTIHYITLCASTFILLFYNSLYDSLFLSGNVSSHSYKKKFSYSFCGTIFFNFVTPDNSLDIICFFMFMSVNKNIP